MAEHPPGLARRPQPARFGQVLFVSSFFVATCGLVYELVAGAMASYLLGDSVTHFSLVIGCYLSAMGVGSWLSRFLDRNLLARFVEVELAVALVGGFEAPLLFGSFALTDHFSLVLFGLVGLTGVLVGLEIPLILRILEGETTLKELVARVMFLDYIGALVASVAFPLVLLPQLGLLRTSLALGLVNALVAGWTTTVFNGPDVLKWRLRAMVAGVLVVLSLGLMSAGELERTIEARLYADPVVYHEVTPYQRIVVTHRERDTRLFLNGGLQFSSVDEYRYHEALVHPALSATDPRRVLVLGGGDGLAVREVLRWPTVETVTLVDLDPAVTQLFTERDNLAALNGFALRDPRVEVVNADAFIWVQEPVSAPYDAILVDFPDPTNFSVGKLYTVYFYRQLSRWLSPTGAVSVQSTSPMFSPDAFAAIGATLREAGLDARPYHAYVPAFGEWGFHLVSHREPDPTGLPEGLRFLDGDTLPTLFAFPRDMERSEPEVNRLDNQRLVALYEQDWRHLWE